MFTTDERLNTWVNRFHLRRKATRELWKAIRHKFEEQGPPFSVRQMFYQMSSIGQVPKEESGYRQVQYALTQMRKAGAIPYGWLADATRWVRKPDTYNNMGDMLAQSQRFYRRALWDTQACHVEIWLEKEALAGVISPVTSEYDVGLYVTRGYPSLSYLYEAAEFLETVEKPTYIYHFGDYDASGKDAARSIREGLAGFGVTFHFEEVAVTEQQISAMNLQTRPAKRSDPRAKRWGHEAVELDAIPPADLRAMVRQVIEQHIDREELARLLRIEAEEKASLAHVIKLFGTSTKYDDWGVA